jgi:hypothetical protein
MAIVRDDTDTGSWQLAHGRYIDEAGMTGHNGMISLLGNSE